MFTQDNNLSVLFRTNIHLQKLKSTVLVQLTSPKREYLTTQIQHQTARNNGINGLTTTKNDTILKVMMSSH